MKHTNEPALHDIVDFQSVPTKQKIILEAMKLFSVHGFSAVSTRTIAAQVGVSNGALYKHFKSKQDIFDAIILQSKQIFINKYKDLMDSCKKQSDLKQMCMNMFLFQIEDEWIVMFRRMLIVEQFRDQQIADIYREFNIEMPLQYQAKVFQALISLGIMEEKDPRVLSIELYAPFFLYHTIPVNRDELIPLLEKHVEYFIENYMNNVDIKNNTFLEFNNIIKGDKKYE